MNASESCSTSASEEDCFETTNDCFGVAAENDGSSLTGVKFRGADTELDAQIVKGECQMDSSLLMMARSVSDLAASSELLFIADHLNE